MGETTGISWTDHTFNPWWGCWKIADECANCYADTTAHRYASQFGELWGRTNPRRFFGDKHWNEPRKWNRKAIEEGVRKRVFVGSMCDWAEIHPIDEVRKLQEAARAELFALIDECRGLDWLLLTKRITDVADLLPWLVDDSAPWPHIWLGVTAGTRAALRKNVPVLRTIPAAVRFISCEPMLEDIPRREWDLALTRQRGASEQPTAPEHLVGPIHWLIVGDESGSKRRPAQIDWFRTAREAATANGVALHVKQWNGPTGGGIEGRVQGDKRKIHLPILDGKRWAEFPK